MSAKPAQYRIRGLAEIDSPTPVPGKEKACREIALSEIRQRPSWEAALMAVGRSKLAHFIPHAHTDRLKVWWPTFSFFSRPWPIQPIKIQPTALGPYLPDSSIQKSTPELKTIEQYYKVKLEEKDHIERVLAMAEDTTSPSRPCSINDPVAFALWCTLFRGSIRDEKPFLEKVGESPVAAYILLHLGCRPKLRDDFIRQILPDPHLTLDLCVEGPFGCHIPDDLLAGAFKEAPHLLCLARYAQEKRNDDDTWKTLIEVAAGHPLAAAFALGLDPLNEQAQKWHALVSPNPEAIYWALRVWTKHHWKNEEFPYWPEYQALIKKDVRWLYHWCRDIDSSEARDAIRWHWPNPWAVEILADLKPEPDFVRELYRKSFPNSDEDDPWTDTLASWAAQFIEEQEVNETSEND